ADTKFWPEENDPYLSPTAGTWDAVAGFRKTTNEDQATLLRDFLFSIPDGAPWPAKGQEKDSVMVDPEAAAALAAAAAKEAEGDKEKDKDKKGDKKDEPRPPQHGALPGPTRF